MFNDQKRLLSIVMTNTLKVSLIKSLASLKALCLSLKCTKQKQEQTSLDLYLISTTRFYSKAILRSFQHNPPQLRSGCRTGQPAGGRSPSSSELCNLDVDYVEIKEIKVEIKEIEELAERVVAGRTAACGLPCPQLGGSSEASPSFPPSPTIQHRKARLTRPFLVLQPCSHSLNPCARVYKNFLTLVCNPQ